MISPLVFLSVLAVYLCTLYPCIAPEDSGEFVAAAWTLGIPHASGYSLYSLLGKAASLLVPWANPAYRVNVLSAALGAGAAVLWAHTLLRLLPSPAPSPDVLVEMDRARWRRAGAWTAALLWAAAPGVWYLSLLAEVYVVEIFLGTLLVWSAARWLGPEAWSRPAFARRWSFSALVFGLGAALHHTFVLFLPGLAGFLWSRLPPRAAKPLSPGRIAMPSAPFRWTEVKPLLRLALIFAAAGFSVSLFLYFRSIAAPLLDTGSPDNLERWLRVALRRDYGTFSLFKDSGAGARLEGMGVYLRSLAAAFTPAGLALAAWGAARLWRDSRPLFAAAALLWAVPGPLFLWLTQPPLQNHFMGIIERFYPLSLLGVMIPLGWGLFQAGLGRPWARRACLLLAPLSLALHAGVSGRGNLHARDFGVNLLKSLPPRSVLWDPGDTAAYAVLYQQAVAGQRPDVASVHYHTTLWGQRQLRRKHPDLLAGPPENGFQTDFLERLLAGPRKDWVFTEVPASLPGANPRDGLARATRYPEDGFPLGLAYRYFPEQSHKLVEPRSQLLLARLTFRWYRKSAPWRALDAPGYSPEIFHARDRFTVEVLKRYAEARTNLGQKFGQYGLRDLAEEEYLTALATDPHQMEAFNNAGVLAFHDGKHAKSAALFRRAIAAAPRNPALRVNLGHACRAAGLNAEAQAAFRAALALDPDSRDALFHLADLAGAGGRYAEALELWRRRRDLEPDSKEANWRLAGAYRAAGRGAEALTTLSEYFLLPLTDEEKTAAEEMRRQLQAAP
jgi:tetratricopeptide (TPR) repeat protein